MLLHNHSSPITASLGGIFEGQTLYHGTGKDFTGFSSFGGSKTATGNPTGKLGTFFTSLPEEAERYVKDFHGGKGNVIHASVQLKNPYQMSMSEFNSLTTPKDWKTVEDFKQFSKTAQTTVENLRKSLESQGYDGIQIGGNGRYAETVVFHPESIKVQKIEPVNTVPDWMK